MPVLQCSNINFAELQALLARYGVTVKRVADGDAIPGSWFGESEAGLIGNTLHLRNDTPVHSALHESCHYICMDESRRNQLHTNAGGDYAEENGVCYLQILLADYVSGFGRDRAFSDMDEWGYTFRLGSSRAWFEQDAEDTVVWLQQHGLIDAAMNPVWTVRKLQARAMPAPGEPKENANER